MWSNFKTIAITGPECTGKTTLAKFLANRLGGHFIPEFAREYLSKTRLPYSLSDYYQMARGQMLRQIWAVTNLSGLLILDTDHHVVRIWGEEKYKKFPSFLQQLYDLCKADFYLLLKPDLPWEPDPYRESPHDRERLFRLYQNLLEKERAPYSIIEGFGEARNVSALKALGLQK
ncbi:MAG: AAA family ATPase [Flavobacteriales bacterium]|nr:AAA family ATPase [Flavobacteriales bacterium]MCX7768083.1 AAA family ATPase [Flavobacteriales bacterium]MDW8410351.1 AAA family ATPase [Flavobacteriales bacterium]